MYKVPEQFLDGDASAGRLMAHARLLLKLSRRFEAIAPAGLRYAAHVANYKSGRVVIHADNGAVAAKIRQMGQRLCDELSKQGAECNVMDVKVQPRQIPYQSTSSTQKPLSAKACGVLRSTTEKLPKGPLRDALDNLLARAATRE
ncbi:MAG: DciA family protein [Azonexus sp.]|nr:DciA family protein [Azonexus sp.]